MPRRAKSGITGVQIGVIAAVVVGGFAGGFLLLTRSKDPFGGLNELPVASYREDASRMRGNQFKIKGRIGARLDQWRTDDGRVFSVVVSDGFKSYPIPVHVPPELNGENIIRGQEYQMKVTVGDAGILTVTEISNI